MADWIELYTPGDSAALLLARQYGTQAQSAAVAADQSKTDAQTAAVQAIDAATIAGAIASRTISTQFSLAGGGSLTGNLTLNLVGDVEVPGNNKLYGTDGAGTRGWYDRFDPRAVANGTAAAPALAFGTDPSTGFYRVSAGVLGLAAAGVLAVQVSAAASAVNYPELVAGAAGTPGRVQLRAVGSDANISMVLSPKGTGGLIAQVPDSTAAGGNARGANATDWQTSRAAATQVASGNLATVGGGGNNTASGGNATVAGGAGNSASGNWATVAGGSGNTASQTRATVGGGINNGASGQDTVIAGGNANTASGTLSWVPGGYRATTRGMWGRGAWAGNFIASQGDAQCGEHPLMRQTTDATATRLTSDNAAPSTTNQIILPNFSVYAGVVMVVARAAGGTDTAVWMVNVAAARANGAGTTAMLLGGGTGIAPTASAGAGSAWRLDIAADTTNGGIALTGTGAVGATINWSARFANVEATTPS